MTLQSINPSTGDKIQDYPNLKHEEVKKKLDQSKKSFTAWKNHSISERAAFMRSAGEVLRKRTNQYAELMAREMGKPVSQGRSEVEKCAWLCEFYAEEAEGFLSEEEIKTDAKKSYITFEPLGALLAVMPWNFPFWQVFRAAVPALIAGNTFILKHASNVPGCAQAMEDLFNEINLPQHVFQNFFIESHDVAKVLEHDFVKAVTLTGSTPAGKAVAAKAGELLKKSVLELGGNDPYLVLEDADVEEAAKVCATSRMINGGQSCIAAKRFIVLSAVLDKFEKTLVNELKNYTFGDPLNEETRLGPLARKDLRDDLHKQVIESVTQGAKLLLGGEIPEGEGAFYPATVLSGVKRGMPVYHEETFGPVASIIRVETEEEAIRVANDTSFGLGAAVFTGDEDRGEKIARKQLNAGSCFVNTFVKSDPRLPFGGIGESGYGRELGKYGIREFVNMKTVYVNQSSKEA